MGRRVDGGGRATEEVKSGREGREMREEDRKEGMREVE